MLQYRNPAGRTCGFVQMTDCVLECRDDKSYATAPVRRTSANASSDNKAFIMLHVPTDVYAKCFDPIHVYLGRVRGHGLLTSCIRACTRFICPAIS